MSSYIARQFSSQSIVDVRRKMIDAISYLTISLGAFYLAAFSGNFWLGAALAFTFHASWFVIFQAGGVIGDPPNDMSAYIALSSYLPVVGIWALVGVVMSYVLRLHQFINGAEMKQKFGSDTNTVIRLVAKFSLWLFLWQLPILIPFELKLVDFPEPWGGIITLAGTAVGFIISYFIFESEVKLQGKDRIINRNQISTMALHLAIPIIAWIAIYVFVQWPTSDAFWYTDMWNFYFTLIFGGAALLYAIIIGFWLETRERSRRDYKNV